MCLEVREISKKTRTKTGEEGRKQEEEEEEEEKCSERAPTQIDDKISANLHVLLDFEAVGTLENIVQLLVEKAKRRKRGARNDRGSEAHSASHVATPPPQGKHT